MELKNNVIKGLFEHQCIKFGEFTLKSGIQSPIYIDLRRIISFPTLMQDVTAAYTQLAKELEFDCIAGIPTAALPFAAVLAHSLKTAMIYPRIPKKPHGTGNVIEGHYKAKQKVLLLDDLITRGTSKQEALEILSSQNLLVSDLIVLIRRGETASHEMKELQVNLHYFLDITEIVKKGLELQYIDEAQYDTVMKFLSSK